MKELSWFERFYTYFIYRDLSYIFSGGLFICVIEYILWNEIILPKGISLEVIGFLLISYYLGLAIGNLNNTIRLFPSEAFLPEGYSSRLVLKQDIIDNFDHQIVSEYLRTMDQQLIGPTIGTSSFLGGLLMIFVATIRCFQNGAHFSIEYYVFAFSLLIYSIYMLFHSRTNNKLIERNENNLVKRINEIKE